MLRFWVFCNTPNHSCATATLKRPFLEHPHKFDSLQHTIMATQTPASSLTSTYHVAQFNSLPHYNSAKDEERVLAGFQDAKAALLAVISKHGLASQVAVCLLHKHFDLEDGELVLEEVSDSSSTSTVVHLRDKPMDTVVAHTWRLAESGAGVAVDRPEANCSSTLSTSLTATASDDSGAPTDAATTASGDDGRAVSVQAITTAPAVFVPLEFLDALSAVGIQAATAVAAMHESTAFLQEYADTLTALKVSNVFGLTVVHRDCIAAHDPTNSTMETSDEEGRVLMVRPACVVEDLPAEAATESVQTSWTVQVVPDTAMTNVCFHWCRHCKNHSCRRH